MQGHGRQTRETGEGNPNFAFLQSICRPPLVLPTNPAPGCPLTGVARLTQAPPGVLVSCCCRVGVGVVCWFAPGGLRLHYGSESESFALHCARVLDGSGEKQPARERPLGRASLARVPTPVYGVMVCVVR